MWTWRMSCRFQRIVPNAGLVICWCDMVLESIFGWRQIAGLCILSAEQFVPKSVRVFGVVSVQCAYKPSTSFPPFVVVAERITNHHHGSAHVWVGLDRKGTPAFFHFPTNALVLSYPVIACIPGSALHISSPSDCPKAVMSRYLLRCFVSIQNSILVVML